MTDAGAGSPSGVLPGVARALVAAARSRALYPREHPAVAASLSRLQSTLQQLTSDAPLAIGITPTALVPDDAEPIADAAAAEADAYARVLEDRETGVGARQLNLCTMVVSIVDVYDALRSHRIYRHGLPTARIKAIMSQRNSAAFNRSLLRRFINLIGLFPVGTLVRLKTDELAVVTHEHPADPFRPQVKIIRDGAGDAVEEPFLVNTWEIDGRGEHPCAVVEALDHEEEQVDPLQFLNPTSGNSGGTA